jgi:hypothetical protein
MSLLCFIPMAGEMSVTRSIPAAISLPASRARAATGRRLRDIAIFGSIILIGLLADDWIATLSVIVLLAGWKFLSRQQGPPIVAAAFSNQWLQVTFGIMYLAITGRQVVEMETADYRPMVLMGLAAITVLFGGFYLAARFRRTQRFTEAIQRPLPWTTNQIAMIYVGTVALFGIIQEIAWSTPGWTQAILMLSRFRYVFLFLIVTRLLKPTPQWPWILAIFMAEVVLGFSGFSADFREPIVIIGIALFGAMDRSKARTWMIVCAIGAVAIGAAVIWTAIKPVIRKNYAASASTSERLNTVLMVTGTTFTGTVDEWKRQTDHMVSRMWAVYFPALALRRVPSLLPHENGKILWDAIDNVLTPRAFFPEKPVLPSQSEEVRKYAGVWVSGRESETSYAFGYVGESYVDFGVPLMFLPILAYGLVLGLAFRWLSMHIRHDELRTGVIIVVFWSTLGLYETSWIMMIGPALTMIVLLGGGAVLLDRMLRVTGRGKLKSSAPLAARGLPSRV